MLKRMKRLKNIAYFKKYFTVDIDGKTYSFYFNCNFFQGIRNIQIAHCSESIENVGFRMCPLRKAEAKKIYGPLPGRAKDRMGAIMRAIFR